MVHYKDKYKEASRCSEHGWIPEPTYKPINFGIATIQEPNQGNEHYYDIKGKRVGVIIIHKVDQLAWRDRDGTFLKMIKELVGKVKCPYCGKICRGRPIGKTDKRNRKDKRITKQENMIPYSVGIKLIDDTIRRLEIQVEYENDLSLRLDDPESKNAGIIGSYMRGEIEQTLEKVLKLREKYPNPEQEVKQLQRQQEYDPDVDMYVRAINMSPQIMSYITERLKFTNAELYRRVMRRLEKENEGKESNIDN